MSNDAPRPSATVVLMRQGADGIETYLVQRHGRAAFGNAWAFPGGVVEAFDARVHDACTGATGEIVDRLLDTPGALNYYSAAIRELFEETGVLLGSARVTSVELDAARDALNDGTITWDDFVRNDGVALDSNALHYVSYWITPAGMPKRFATRFFLARMPEGQTAQHCGRELVGFWHGSLPMIFPTVSTLRFLDGFATVGDALEAADDLAAEGIVEILPKAVVHDGKREIVLPGDPRYADSAS